MTVNDEDSMNNSNYDNSNAVKANSRPPTYNSKKPLPTISSNKSNFNGRKIKPVNFDAKKSNKYKSKHDYDDYGEDYKSDDEPSEDDDDDDAINAKNKEQINGEVNYELKPVLKLLDKGHYLRCVYEYLFYLIFEKSS